MMVFFIVKRFLLNPVVSDPDMPSILVSKEFFGSSAVMYLIRAPQSSMMGFTAGLRQSSTSNMFQELVCWRTK